MCDENYEPKENIEKCRRWINNFVKVAGNETNINDESFSEDFNQGYYKGCLAIKQIFDETFKECGVDENVE